VLMGGRAEGLACADLGASTPIGTRNAPQKMPPDHFCSHLRQDGQIDLLSSPDCHLFIAVSEKTHNAHI
jgi:hypothetical protein